MSVWNLKESLDTLGAGKEKRKRSARVGDAIRNELSALLVQGVRDPRLADVSVTRVVVSDDLKYARIYYSIFGSMKKRQAAGKAFERAKGFMRSHIARELNLRHTPEMQFFYDETSDKVEEVEKLFQEIAKDREAHEDS